jgi:3-phenylpropionate/trans-cinnamate dioxygenase ferredoxin reductase component
VSRRVVVAGGSLGGLRAVERLRAAGWREHITVVGAEPHMPYNRPPLSKAVLRELVPNGDEEAAAREVAAAAAFPVRVDSSGIDWRLGRTVTGTDLDARRLSLDDGETISYDGLVVATGLRPRRLRTEATTPGRHVLRTADHAVRLRGALVAGAHVVIVGAGFIGCEVAATARQLGCDVTVVEPLPEPMVGPLGGELAGAVRLHHERRGIRFRLARSLVEVRCGRNGGLEGVALDDGSIVRCDVLVEAIGSHPNVEWLEGNGLDLSNGVLCDDYMRVEGRADIVAVGDVARRPCAFLDGQPLRTEHWCVPTDTARRAAPTLVAQLDGLAPASTGQPPLSTFWTDQFDLRIQGLGVPGIADEYSVLEGRVHELESGVAVGAWRRGTLTGVLTVGLAPAAMRPYRERLLATQAGMTVTA